VTGLYFIQCGEAGPIKIGASSRPLNRLRDLQVANPAPLKLLAHIHTAPSEERRLHAELNAHRVRGEWFEPHPEVLAVVDLVASTREPWVPRINYPLEKA
jgi:hypothetical protein